MTKVTDIIDIVKEMTVLELAELVKAFEEEFGVSAAGNDSFQVLFRRRSRRPGNHTHG